MRVACILASRSIAGIDGGTNSMVRTILVVDSGRGEIDGGKVEPGRMRLARAEPASVGLASVAAVAACAIMNAIMSRICTIPIGSSRVSL